MGLLGSQVMAEGKKEVVSSSQTAAATEQPCCGRIKAAVEKFGRAPQNAQDFDAIVDAASSEKKEPPTFLAIERCIAEIHKIPVEIMRQWEADLFLNPNTRVGRLTRAHGYHLMYDPGLPYPIRQRIRIIVADSLLRAHEPTPDALLMEIIFDQILHPRRRRMYVWALDDPRCSHENRQDIYKMMMQITGEKEIEGSSKEEKIQRRFDSMFLLLTLPPNDPDATFYGFTEENREDWARELLEFDPRTQCDVGRRAFLYSILHDTEESWFGQTLFPMEGEGEEDEEAPLCDENTETDSHEDEKKTEEKPTATEIKNQDAPQ
jgi:hypothetical protein